MESIVAGLKGVVMLPDWVWPPLEELGRIERRPPE